MSLLRSLYGQWRHLIHELAKFGIVGAFNTMLDFGVANYLHLLLHWPGVAAKTVSVAVAATSSYFMNRHWTFRHRARTGLGREYTLFFLLNGVGLAITAAIMGIAKYGFDLHDQVALNIVRLFAIGVATLFRFWSYKRWVFGHEVEPAAADLSDAPPGEAPIVRTVPEQRSKRQPARAER